MLAGDGVSNSEISEVVGVSRPTVLAWRGQFEKEGLTEFGEVAAGRGPKPSISEEKIAEIVELTLHSKPEGQTHWSCRSMAQVAGVSPATVQRIWSARGLSLSSCLCKLIYGWSGEVGGKAVGIGQCEGSQGLFPPLDNGAFDEAAGGLALGRG